MGCLISGSGVGDSISVYAWDNSTALLEGCEPQGLQGHSHLLSPQGEDGSTGQSGALFNLFPSC